ncbi:hypothetical protein G7046_g4152 [Stylonectria norvegica]|nr:hypothetical protein G7046_g4152 [Stylonectria norvegica]
MDDKRGEGRTNGWTAMWKGEGGGGWDDCFFVGGHREMEFDIGSHRLRRLSAYGMSRRLVCFCRGTPTYVNRETWARAMGACKVHTVMECCDNRYLVHLAPLAARGWLRGCPRASVVSWWRASRCKDDDVKRNSAGQTSNQLSCPLSPSTSYLELEASKPLVALHVRNQPRDQSRVLSVVGDLRAPGSDHRASLRLGLGRRGIAVPPSPTKPPYQTTGTAITKKQACFVQAPTSTSTSRLTHGRLPDQRGGGAAQQEGGE